MATACTICSTEIDPNSTSTATWLCNDMACHQQWIDDRWAQGYVSYVLRSDRYTARGLIGSPWQTAHFVPPAPGDVVIPEPEPEPEPE